MNPLSSNGGLLARVALSLAALVGVGCSAGPAAPEKPTKLELGQIGTVVGTGERATDPIDGNADGEVDPPIPRLEAHLSLPIDVSSSPDGRLFVIDWNGHKIRALGPDGMLSFVTGTGKEGDACEVDLVDGLCPVLSAEMNHPTDVTFDQDGRLLIAAWHNSKIKRADLGAGMLENVCGTGARKFEGDGLPCRTDAGKDQVSFDLPSSVTFDAAGNLFVSDQANQVIRRIGRADGVVKTVVGSCPGTLGFGCASGRGYSGDGGPATDCHLANDLGQSTDPQGKIAFDGEGNLYVADTENHVIRKVAPGSDGILGDGDPVEEVISTVAGTGTQGYGGDGGPATSAALSLPTDIAIAGDGTLYIADRGNDCIRAVAVDGTISTVAGRCTEPGYRGDGALATEARLNHPYGVALDGQGKLYIADTENQVIREVILAK